MIPVSGKTVAKVWPWGDKAQPAVVPRQSPWTPLPDSLKNYPTPPDLTFPPPYSKSAFPPLPTPTSPKPHSPTSNFDITPEKPSKDPVFSCSPDTYMTEFFTKPCNGPCPGISCLYTHRNERIRRKPRRLPSGHFNYMSVKCQRKGCNSADCPFAHTVEEVMYHPEQYKTRMCGYGVNGNGVCGGFGVHCPFAHRQNEIRRPESFNCKDENEKKPEVNTQKEQEMWVEKMQKKKKKQGNLDIETYKTVACCRTGCKSSVCPNYHNAFDKRRNPKLFSYLSVPCKFAFDLSQRKFVRPGNCPQGDNCHFAHTKYESYYHPQFYKTQICCYYATSGVCKRGGLCAYVHDGKEGVTPVQECNLEMVTAMMTSNQQLAKETGSLKCQVDSLKCAIKLLTSKVTCPHCHLHERCLFLTCGDSICQSCSQIHPNTCPLCHLTISVVGSIRL